MNSSTQEQTFFVKLTRLYGGCGFGSLKIFILDSGTSRIRSDPLSVTDINTDLSVKASGAHYRYPSIVLTDLLPSCLTLQGMYA